MISRYDGAKVKESEKPMLMGEDRHQNNEAEVLSAASCYRRGPTMLRASVPL